MDFGGETEVFITVVALFPDFLLMTSITVDTTLGNSLQ